MSDYGIQFSPTLERPSETMVGETVFDGEGNAIGWIVNAVDEPDEATMLKLHGRMNAALLDMYEVLVPEWHREGISMDELIDCVIRAHQIVEDAATAGVGTCQIEERHGDWCCTGCGEMVGTYDTASELYIDGNAIELWRHCPNCGRRIIKEVAE